MLRLDLLLQCAMLEPSQARPAPTVLVARDLDGQLCRSIKAIAPDASITVYAEGRSQQDRLRQMGVSFSDVDYLAYSHVHIPYYDYAIAILPFRTRGKPWQYVFGMWEELAPQGRLAVLVDRAPGRGSPLSAAARNLIAEYGYWEFVEGGVVLAAQKFDTSDLWKPRNGYSSYYAEQIELALAHDAQWHRVLEAYVATGSRSAEALLPLLTEAVERLMSQANACFVWDKRTMFPVANSILEEYDQP